jgi:PhnB protein
VKQQHPGEFMQVNPYLIFNGECEAAFKFYERCLGGKIEALFPHEGTPAEEGIPAEWKKKILHARMSVNGQVIMGSDAPPDRYRPPTGFSVIIGLTDTAEAERIFKALSEKGSIQMPLQQTFWAARFAMFVDQFGTPWMINCGQPD